MFGEQAKKAFADLNLEYCAVAIKFSHNKPEGYEQAENKDVFCKFLRKAQDENRAFYITVDNEICMGKCVLGMVDFDGGHSSGNVGYIEEIYRSTAANARVYYEAPSLKRGSCNYVVFCPVSQCNFDPDLVVCIANTDQAQLILRATSYISGDIWESKCSYVMSCAWTYAYPYISGKVNHLFTGMHLGMKIMGVYPEGLHILTIPYQKLDEVVTSLTEMRKVPLGLLKDEESQKMNTAMREHIDSLGSDPGLTIKIDH